jgi:hypothetical protein
MRKSPIVLLAITLAVFASSAPLSYAQSSRLIVASGLDNPLGLAFGPDGFLYVVEAGRGGTSTLCLPPVDPMAPTRCYGPSGAITRVVGLGNHQRVVTGLPSAAGPTGREATGPADIAFGFGAAWITVGSGGDPAARADFEASGILFRRLTRIMFTGERTNMLDLAGFEAANNPDGGLVDSNPPADGALYVTNMSTSVGTGEVVRIVP